MQSLEIAAERNEEKDDGKGTSVPEGKQQMKREIEDDEVGGE